MDTDVRYLVIGLDTMREEANQQLNETISSIRQRGTTEDQQSEVIDAWTQVMEGFGSLQTHIYQKAKRQHFRLCRLNMRH